MHDVIHLPGPFPVWEFYFDICEWRILPVRAWTPALMFHLTNPCTKRKVLSLTKPKGKIYKTKSLGNYITHCLRLSFFLWDIVCFLYILIWNHFLLTDLLIFLVRNQDRLWTEMVSPCKIPATTSKNVCVVIWWANHCSRVSVKRHYIVNSFFGEIIS